MNIVTSYHNGMTHVIELENDRDLGKILWRFKVDGYYNRRIGVRTFIVRGWGEHPVSWFRSAKLHFIEISILDTYESINEWQPESYWCERIHWKSKIQERQHLHVIPGGVA